MSDFFKVKSSDYKALSQLQQFPDTRIAKSVHGIRGRFDLINSPYNRFAPGLSLTYAKSLPRQTVVFKDGDRPFYLYHISSSADLEFIKHTISYCGYHLHGRPDRILVVESGGGMGIICALAAQPKHIDIVAPEKDLAAFIQSHYHRHTVSQPIRSYLKQANHRYDIIQIDDWGPTVPGAASLSQSHSFTKEAFIEYLRHLKPGGMLIITRKLLLPPADSLRLWATAYDSLQKLQIRSPHRCIAIFRNWDTFTLLVSNRSISSGPQTLSFLEKRNFDIVYLDDAPKDLINRFAIFDHPYHYLQTKHLAQAFQNSVEKQYFDSYLMDVVPQDDKRPYPSRFLKWKRFGELYQTTGSRLYSLMMSGDIVVWVVFGEALLIAVLLLIIPSVILKRKQSRPHKGQTLFFLSVGAGFMFVEVFFIKRLILIFEDPVTSFTLTVTAVLIFSAVGGYWSQRWHRQDLPKLSLLIIAVLLVQLLIVDVILEYAFHVRSDWQYVIAVITILPVGIIMGIPFPLAVRTMAIISVHRSHAWAANGASSVLTSIVAMQLALSYGIQYILFAAIGAYLLAFIGAMVSRHDTESS